MRRFFLRRKGKVWRSIPKFVHGRHGCHIRRLAPGRIGGAVNIPNILIVDSHFGVQELLKEEFLADGCRVMATGEADGMRDLIQFFRPQVIILDPFLNGENRGDLLASLKTDFPHIPVLILTAYSGSPGLRFSRADGYVIKSSACVDEVKRKIGKILARTAGRLGKKEGWRYIPQYGNARRAETAG